MIWRARLPEIKTVTNEFKRRFVSGRDTNLCGRLRDQIRETVSLVVVEDETIIILEARIGLLCVATVVYNDCSEQVAAISVSGMTSRVTDERIPFIGNTVRDVAVELTIALGGTMPAIQGKN